MQRSELKLRQKVMFGRPNGERTLGKIIKLNPTTAKIETIEARGEKSAGQIWRVPYSLISPADQQTTATPAQKPVQQPKEKLKYSILDDDNLLLQALSKVYGDLSPENLSCDGEASAAHIRQRRAVLERKLRGLTIALGREIPEDELWNWERSKREYEQANPCNYSKFAY